MEPISSPLVTKPKINKVKSKKPFLWNKVICKVGKESNEKNKKEFQSIFYQVHISAQFSTSLISDAILLAPNQPWVDLLLGQLKHTLIFFLLIILLTSSLCISAGPGQREISNHHSSSLYYRLKKKSSMDISFRMSLRGFLAICSTHKVPYAFSLVWRYHLPSQSHSFLQGQATCSVGKLVDWGVLTLFHCDHGPDLQNGLDGSTNFIELLQGLVYECT